eukprot:365522-Chlamydomonas_euryale.AAC.16
MRRAYGRAGDVESDITQGPERRCAAWPPPCIAAPSPFPCLPGTPAAPPPPPFLACLAHQQRAPLYLEACVKAHGFKHRRRLERFTVCHRRLSKNSQRRQQRHAAVGLPSG